MKAVNMLVKAQNSLNQIAMGSGTIAGIKSPENTCRCPAAEDIPCFIMEKGLDSVHEVWDEWNTGINGKMSVVKMNDRYGTKWRSKPAQRKLYLNRLLIVEEIKHRAQGCSVDLAIKELEDICTDSIEDFT